MKELCSTSYQSPIGKIEMLFDSEVLIYLDFADNPNRLKKLLTRRFGAYTVKPAKNKRPIHGMLEQYFAGKSVDFSKVKLSTGGTAFQQSVWHQLKRIKRGSTMDYASLAANAGNAKAIRAAASSNARNPISIVIPCHRVIGKDGSLRGYAGGVERKRYLLKLEGALSSEI